MEQTRSTRVSTRLQVMVDLYIRHSGQRYCDVADTMGLSASTLCRFLQGSEVRSPHYAKILHWCQAAEASSREGV